MTEVYNPETRAYERIEALELEARRIRGKLDGAHNDAERRVLERQLHETEAEIALLRRRFQRKPRTY